VLTYNYKTIIYLGTQNNQCIGFNCINMSEYLEKQAILTPKVEFFCGKMDMTTNIYTSISQQPVNQN